MPRPGPRPYECVKRAWHSDRHLPIRGSLIQEIFRLVNDVHKAETKKNKEWQEKLPIVVLKAEEIMYSKANSEVEYVDLKTLRARVDDAINTIVRRDESCENGKLLQPCIEAALHLGCIPRRSSRSQRDNSPRYYLNPGTKADPSIPPGNANQATHIPFVFQQSKFMPATSKNISTSYSVYPLYFGDQIQSASSIRDFNIPACPKSHPIEAGKAIVEQHISSSKAPIINSKAVVRRSMEKPNHEGGCDLSLRLGPLVIPNSSESIWSRKVANGGLGSSKEERKPSTPLRQLESEFSFFPEADDEEKLDSSSTKRSKAIEMNIEDMVRKRKADLVGS